MTQGRTKERKPITREEKLNGREAILAVLNRIVEEDGFLEQLTNNPDEALKGYCVLTKEELEALVNADIEKIEGWLNRLDTRKVKAWLSRLNQKLDPPLAAWLWRGLRKKISIQKEVK